MRKAQKYARTSALPAIAAALALSSTPIAAQQAQPVTTEPAPVVTPTPAPAPSPTPDTTAPTSIDTSTLPAADTATPTTKTVTTRTVKHTTHVAASKPARFVSHPAPTHVVSHAAAPAKAPAPAAAPPTATAAAHQPPPVVSLGAKPAPAPATAASSRLTGLNRTTMLIGGLVLALLVLAIAAVSMARSRRRRREEQEWADAQTMAYEPFEAEPAPEPVVHEEQPAIVAPEPSAFAWGNERPAEQASPTAEPTAEDDRLPGESWVERAYRGPSPANPSVSLKARLKRAAFFDKREREAAAGIAEPVDPSAGLPDAMIEEQAEERELA